MYSCWLPSGNMRSTVDADADIAQVDKSPAAKLKYEQTG